jgi:hypothetical protein
MKFSSRSLWLAAILALAGLGIILERAQWFHDQGLDFWNIPSLNGRLAREQDELNALSAKSSAVQERLRIKSELAEDLAAGRRNLVEVAICFRELNAESQFVTAQLRGAHPDLTDDELVVRNILDCILAGAEGRPELASVAARIEAQFQQLRQQPGGFRLPPP